MKVMPNFVLIKVDYNHEYINVGDKKIWLRPINTEAQHFCRYGQVEAVCDKLTYKKKVNDKRDAQRNPEYQTKSMPWLTDIEVKVGDLVWFDYLPVMMVKKKHKNGLHYHKNGVDYYYIHYKDLIAAKRLKRQCTGEKKEDWKVIMLNGRLLLQPIESKKGILTTFNKYQDKKMKVCYAGTPNREYETGEVDGDVKAGDTVLVKYVVQLDDEMKPKIMLNMLEYHMHRVFDDEDYYIKQNKDIMAKFT